MTKRIAALVLTMSGMTMALSAHAESRDRGGDHFFGGDHGGRFCAVAPEIDPSSAISALTLLMGGVTVLRSRFSKK